MHEVGRPIKSAAIPLHRVIGACPIGVAAGVGPAAARPDRKIRVAQIALTGELCGHLGAGLRGGGLGSCNDSLSFGNNGRSCRRLDLGDVLQIEIIDTVGCSDAARSEEHTSELQSLMSISYARLRLTQT